MALEKFMLFTNPKLGVESTPMTSSSRLETDSLEAAQDLIQAWMLNEG